MSDISHRLRQAAQPGAYVATDTLVEAAEYVEKLERIVFDKLDNLTITSPPSTKRTTTTKKATTK